MTREAQTPTTLPSLRKPGMRSGRPTLAASAGLSDTILDAATTLFLRDGFAATSMEAAAAAAGVSKRTLYARYANKSVLLQAVVARLIARWLPDFDGGLDQPSLEASLQRAACRMLATALAPEALALYRLIIAEAGRFPELAHILHEAGAQAGILRIAGILKAAGIADPLWSAEQFQRLVLGGPQHRALGLGLPYTEAELDDWATRSVTLFLHGVRPGVVPPSR